jgi:hypothetical protein
MEFHSAVYDPFIANRAGTSDCIIDLVLNKEDILNLSLFVWKEYEQILTEYLDLEFDYFEENKEEPFPTTKKTFVEQPELIDSYLKLSTLWRDSILENFLFPAKDGVYFEYYIIGYNEAKFENESLILSFNAVLNKSKK